MSEQDLLTELSREMVGFFAQPNAFRSILILIASVLASYVVSRYIAKLFIRAAQIIALKADTVSTEETKLRLRRIETYLSVFAAVLQALIVGVVAFYVWQVVSPAASVTTAAIGAGAFFIVIAGATLGMILRDITAGSAMIIERWFDIGDHIRVEPFLDVSGVVEKITLRSTKLRSLNGEIIWMHNQHMQSVKVTPRGVRTIEVDVFFGNETIGRSLVEKVLQTMPVSPLTVTSRPMVIKQEKWGENLWLLTVVGKTPPGREWLMEDFFVQSLIDLDNKRRGNNVLVRKPLARYADEDADRSFRRAVRSSELARAATRAKH